MTTMDPIERDEQARSILRGNDRGSYTVPTAGLYPYQWNWDSAFSAWGIATFDPDRAWTEVETLMSGQWPSGMVPHILFHKPDPGYFPGPEVWGADHGPIPSSGISQPPVAATLIREIHKRDADDKRLRTLFPKLKAWHAWFMNWRSDKGAIFITHPWEPGRDNAPDWDAAMAAIDPVGVGEYARRDTSHVDPSMRPTKEEYDRYVWLVQHGRRLGWDEAAMAKDRPLAVADPTMTFILLRANRDLAHFADVLGEDRTEIDGWIETLEAGAKRLWNAELAAFDAIDLATGEHTGNVSNASFLCWYAGLDEPQMLAHLETTFEACRYPVPSHPVGTPKFDARRYWRGPTWAFMNSMIGRGLAEMGHRTQADRLRLATRDLIGEHGFAEYFDPLTGAPAGGGMFSWTAAVWLAWASPSAEVA
ncbi:MAG: trehalase family glycosidase [Paracoccaceae bacterium]|nr:trehalase family glycosidase [Paracoccaceae bacterium]